MTNTRPAGKKAVLAINCTEEKLKSFIAQRATSHGIKPPKIYQCRIFVKDTHSAARLIIDAAFSGTLREPEFWPRPLYVRLWNFEKYTTTSNADESEPTDSNATQPITSARKSKGLTITQLNCQGLLRKLDNIHQRKSLSYWEYSARYALQMMVATTTCGREYKPPHYTTPGDRLNDQRGNKTQAC